MRRAAAALLVALPFGALAQGVDALPGKPELQLLSSVVRLVKRDFARATDDAVLASGCADALASAAGAGERAARSLEALPVLLARARAASAGRLDDRRLARICIEGMVAMLDSHSKFLDEDEYRALYRGSPGVAAIGVELRKDGGTLVVVDAFDGSPAARAGLRAGDRILRIDGADAGGLALGEASDRLRGAVGSTVALVYERPGASKPAPKPLDVAIKREIVRLQTVRAAWRADRVLELRVTRFVEQTRSDVQREAARVAGAAEGEPRGIVLDLRDNSGGLLASAVDVAGLFLPEGAPVGSMHGLRGRLLESYRASDRGQRGIAPAPALTERLAQSLRTAPLAVLVNTRTASGAEILAAALQANRRALLVGEPTLGMGSIQTLFPLGTIPGTALKLTTAYWQGPKDAELDGNPLRPDVGAKEAGAPAAAFDWIAAGGVLP